MLWTPQGYYDASPGAEDLIGWQVNQGRDEAPEFYAASRFRDRFHRPDVIDRVLQELDVDAAVAKADAAKPVAPARAVAAPATVLDILPPTVAIIEPQEGAPAPAGELTVTYTVSAPERDPPTRREAARRRRARCRERPAAAASRPAAAAPDRGAAAGRRRCSR